MHVARIGDNTSCTLHQLYHHNAMYNCTIVHAALSDSASRMLPHEVLSLNLYKTRPTEFGTNIEAIPKLRLDYASTLLTTVVKEDRLVAQNARAAMTWPKPAER